MIDKRVFRLDAMWRAGFKGPPAGANPDHYCIGPCYISLVDEAEKTPGGEEEKFHNESVGLREGVIEEGYHCVSRRLHQSSTAQTPPFS